MARLGALPAAKGSRDPIKIRDLSDSPVVISFDPGVTTGWSVLQVHPQALADPEFKILPNIEHWSHGQIDSRKFEDGKQREIFDGAGRLEYTDLAAEHVFAECQVVDQLLEIFDAFPGAVPLVEDFIPQRLDKSRDFLSPVRITNLMDYGLYQRGFQSFRQMSSEATGPVSNDRLRSWGLYLADGLEHARDADRHSIMWMRKCSTKRRLREACWPHLYGEYEVKDPVASAREKRPVFKMVKGPYYIPDGKSWSDVETKAG